MRLLEQITQDRSHFVRRMSSLKAILQGIVLMCKEHETSTCTFDTFLELVMCDANDAERARAASTARILDLLVSLKETLKEEKPKTMAELTKVIEAEAAPVFRDKACRHGTVIVRDMQELVKIAFGDREKVDIERMAFRLKVDLEKEMSLQNFVDFFKLQYAEPAQRKSRRGSITGSSDSRWSMVLNLRAQMRSSRRSSLVGQSLGSLRGSLDSNPASDKAGTAASPAASPSPAGSPGVRIAVGGFFDAADRRASKSPGDRATSFASVLAGAAPVPFA